MTNSFLYEMGTLIVLLGGLCSYFYWTRSSKKTKTSVQERISQVITSLSEKDSELSSVYEKISQVTASLNKKDSEIASLQASLNEKDSELCSLQASLNEKDSDISFLQANLNEKDSDISFLQANLNKKDSEISSLQHEKETLLGYAQTNQKTNLELETEFSEGSLEGKQFVILGTSPHISREEAKALIEKEGGKVFNSPNAQTNYVFVGKASDDHLKEKQKLRNGSSEKNYLIRLKKILIIFFTSSNVNRETLKDAWEKIS